ncbi:MAG TPA: twin-arginine translocation signal domain-containing protein, partial [Pyrinomonadaceae bacterium]|nr:twin-arginine translocation signal domain-containing protein [Pyrinomonadaceae bacterium]
MSEDKIKSSEITPESVYLNRRNFMKAGLVAGTTFATGLAYRFFNAPPPPVVETAKIETIKPAENTLPLED